MSLPFRRVLLAVVVTLAAVPAARPANFGVPSGGDPEGWFILVGKDAVDESMSNFFGDITRELRLFIEITGRDLDICIYDPGMYDPALGANQLDFAFDPLATPSLMRYELLDPLGASVKRDNTSFGVDTAASNNALWCFYRSAVDGQVAAGTYQLVVQMIDGPGRDQHANIFGVTTTPDYDAYAYYATVGHSVVSGALLGNGRIRLYPWMARGAHGAQPSRGDGCALEVQTFDMDAPTAGAPPPQGEVVTSVTPAWTETFGVSGDGQLEPYAMLNMAGLNASDDHGIYTVELRLLTAADGVVETNLVPPLPAAIDFNAFSFQVYDTGQLSPALFYPIFPPDPLQQVYQSRRLYLPRSGSAPLKEYLGHRITNPPPARLYALGQTVRVDVDVLVVNPNVYDLANVVGQTWVNPSADLTDPVNVATMGGQGGMATPSGRRIDFSFNRVRGGRTATVRYSVDFTPSATGFFWLTGDGTDFVGGATPTWMMWDTPFATAETARPCSIQTEIEIAPCSVTAVGVGPSVQVCQGETFLLDGGASSEVSCPGGILEYRWSGPGIASPSYSTDPTLGVASTMPGLNAYTLDLRCQGDTGCSDATMLQVQVSNDSQPTADAGGNRTVGDCDVPIRIGAPGLPEFVYRWTSSFPIGSLLDRSDIAEPMFVETTPGLYDLTLTVTSSIDPACSDQTMITVEVGSGAPLGVLGNVLRARKQGDDVELGWTLGRITPDRYNVHRAVVKADIDKTGLPASYTAPVRNSSAVTVGLYIDTGAVSDPAPLFLYETWGRDCSGQSAIVF